MRSINVGTLSVDVIPCFIYELSRVSKIQITLLKTVNDESPEINKMAHLKKNNSWLMPSFDSATDEKVRKRQIKRSSSQVLEEISIKETSQNIYKKRCYTSSLASLLKACEPQKPNELAVSRQKQQEILDWLQYKACRNQPFALVLSGPSGCGKTVAVKLLAKENGFDVIEWINPIDQIMDENNRIMRQGDKFEEYLVRATRYNSVLSSYSKRILLIKDFPNVYFEDKESFYNLLEKYFQLGREAVVFICTETGSSKVLQSLFPLNIREKYDIGLININPVTQAAMKNILKRVSNVLNTNAGHILNVSQHKIDEILSNSIGDIRSSLLNLIFISLKVPEELSKNDCGSREESLGLLHGIGRVTNPKRVTNGDTWKFVHDPDDIAIFFQSQTTTFLNFLQENYLNTLRDIELANTCADILSLGDTLNSEWRDSNLTKVTLSFSVRGIMVTNEKPVSGWNPVRKPPSNPISVRRVLSEAEVHWYETVIKPKSDNDTASSNVDVEDIE